MLHSSSRRLILQWLGYPILAVVTFVFTVHYLFPYQRLDLRIGDALAKSFLVKEVSIRPGWVPGDIVVENLVLVPREGKGSRAGSSGEDKDNAPAYPGSG